jgi:hypothetical protein
MSDLGRWKVWAQRLRTMVKKFRVEPKAVLLRLWVVTGAGGSIRAYLGHVTSNIK